jgi:hypothetical protein
VVVVFASMTAAAHAAPIAGGRESVNLYVQTGSGFDTTRDPVVGRSFNRSVIITGQVVPEPTSVVLFVIAGAGAFGCVRRWKRSRRTSVVGVRL